MRPDLAVVGSVNHDLVARCARLPRAGETVTDATFERHPGGKGANQAVAAARLGVSVSFYGRVGPEPVGTELIMALEEAGVDAGHVGIGEEATGVALILTRPKNDLALHALFKRTVPREHLGPPKES